MSVHVTDDHIRKAEELVAETHAKGGLAPVDLERFWADDAKACENPWSAACPQVPLGIGMSKECLFAELGIEGDWYRLVHDPEYFRPLCKRYNDIAERVVGKRLLGESKANPDAPTPLPPVKQLHDIFEARNEWTGDSYWMHQVAHTPEELAALLDRVEARLEDLRSFLLPPEWDEVAAEQIAAGARVPVYRGERGPVTFAMSIYGVENMIFLIMDNPELARRFSDAVANAMIGRAHVLDREAGRTPETWRHGWFWRDDNCCMFNKELYDFWARPILKKVFDLYCPNPEDLRGQHSDSDMAQHLPTLGELGLTSANFGPNLTVTEIREHLPRAVIRGQLAPFTFSRNEEVNMVAELIRDHEMAQEKKGLVFATAGSINNGSRLSGMRLLMAAIQRYGQYSS